MNFDEEKEIRSKWFKDHKAKITRHTEDLLILDWGKLGTNVYRVRYVLDGGYLFVSGDLGEAAFCLTWNAGKQGLKSLADKNINYLFGKLSAWNGEKYDFNSELAIDCFNEEIAELREQYNDWGNKSDLEHIDTLRKLKRTSVDCISVKDWVSAVNRGNLFEELSGYDQDCWEWLFSIGNEIPRRIQSYLIGIKMAYEQLEDKNEN